MARAVPRTAARSQGQSAAATRRTAPAGPESDGRSPLRRRSARGHKTSELVARDIVQDIVDRGLQEGDRLPTESAMLLEYGVGRASLREALRILEVNGLISIRPGPNGGPVVGAVDARDLGRTLSLYLHMSRATVRELVEARLILEPVMARLAAERTDRESLQVLDDVLRDETVASLEDPGYIRAANDFHRVVTGLSGNRVLDLIARAIKELFTDRVTESGLVPPEARPSIRRAHRKVGDAIAAGNARQAEKLMGEHMGQYAEFVEQRQPALLDEVVIWG